MKLEYQVVSLELAKRLKELGIKQESYFYWFGVNSMYPGCKSRETFHPHKEAIDRGDMVSAFTVAEMGEMLPIRVKGAILVGGHLNRGWVLQYRLNNTVDHEEYDPNEADARAKMLIYLIEQGLPPPTSRQQGKK